MIEDIDIYRSAKIFMDQHGQNAFEEALKRAAQFKAQGDESGKNVWLRISDAVAFMQMKENLAEKTVQ